ncbi:MAG TPA: T9SS type A sorting domain-containing protein, partial [Bacteroidota bacterium]|nr:T9SS type A sorting domain-containing protein [Bacteroidota bacterium]
WYSAWAEAGLPLSVRGAMHGSRSGSFRLLQSYPNPGNPSSTISYSLASPAFIHLVVYALDGAPVRTLVDGLQGPGDHQVRFDAAALSSGVYFYRMQSGGLAQTGKLIVLR